LEGEKCSGSLKTTSDIYSGICCVGGCEAKKIGSKWIIGIIILLVLAIGGWFLYQKSKQNPKTGDIFKKRADMYEKRMNPEPVEVRKSISKI
jgi:hypothetical protein